MTDVDTSPSTSPAAIDAVPLRHPWRWVAAVVIVILVALFLYGAATNEAYRWHIFTKYLFNERILLGVSNTLQLTVYSMVLAIVLGVILAVMRLSPNPVFRSVSWVYPVDIPRHTDLRAVDVLGPDPDDLCEHPAGCAVRAVVLSSQPAGAVHPVFLATLGLALNEAAYMAEIIRAGISSVPEGQSGGVDSIGHVVGDGDAPYGAPAGDAGDHPADRQRGHQHAEDHIAGHRRAVHVRPIQHCHPRDRRARVRARSRSLLVAAAWYLAVTSILMVGQYYLERHYSRGISRTLTRKQLEALAKAQTGTVHDDNSIGITDQADGAGRAGVQELRRAQGAQGHHARGRQGRGAVLWSARPGRASRRSCAASIIWRQSMQAGCYVDGDLIGYRDRGTSCYEMSPREAAKQRRDIGMVFQHFNLFPHRTALENVIEAPIHVKGSRRARPWHGARDLLDQVGLAEKADRLSGAAVRRPAAAGGDRPRPGDEPQADAVRRAHLGAGPGARRRGARR